jgi:hypothetical protein
MDRIETGLDESSLCSLRSFAANLQGEAHVALAVARQLLEGVFRP